MQRKLASIQQIRHVRPIDGADNIEVVGVLGWECVAKKGEFQEGDPCVYFEIDSLLPEEPRYEFLMSSSYRKDLGRFRLRTARFRKQLSQGLALPLSMFPEVGSLPVGSDLTEILNVEKYEPPIPANIAGSARAFSWPLAKTDEPRIQQDEGLMEPLVGKPYYMSLKLDGTSCTFVIDPNDGEYHVCGRNYSYVRAEGHSFWGVSDRYDIERSLRSLGGHLALQGEIVGPGIQNNKMGLGSVDFYVFNVVDLRNRRRLLLDDALSVCGIMGLNFVPILERGESFSYDVRQLLDRAKGKYREHFPGAKKDQEREGIVVRSMCGSVSFKAISNDFLLKDD